ncbi:hypothetical protein [Lacipirellula parvula]|uniref:Uncharacterized protein n=1 Tax=Lacipirellula parvula TaxID=2650471 RepID=A0A5K7XET3_9BACT|nr:hypothetical protein [Lacipirellula parvula]BBO35008.1 hypothetical protein PLANPX_4620 [Lacipirellula parvula]
MNDDQISDPIDQEIRINEFREAAREAVDGEMYSWEDPDAPPAITEQFWANVLEYEQTQQSCHFLMLERVGIELPPPEQLNDEQIGTKLWEVIHALSGMQVYLSQTDHWSDRELYEELWHDTLREYAREFPPDSGWRCHIDFLSSGSDEDNLLYLKHYADEEYRRRWHDDWPDDVMPSHEDPQYDRDSKLPKPLEP